MKARIHDSHFFNALRPLDVAGFLFAKGWQQDSVRAGLAQVWTKGDRYEVLLPLDKRIDGFPIRMADLFQTLERAESVEQVELISQIRAGVADTVGVAVDGESVADGTMGVSDGSNLLSAAKGIIWAAASSAARPRAYYQRRRPPEANDFLKQVRWVQSEVGSFRLRLLAPIPPLPQSADGLFPEHLLRDDPPFQRRVTQTLARGLEAASRTAQNLGDSDVDELVAQGLSANLCDAVAEVKNALGSSSELQVSVAWSWRRPQRENFPTQFSFGSDAVELLEEFGRYLKEFAPQEEFELWGTIVKLERQPDQAYGWVVVRTFLESGAKLVRFQLPEDEYALATAAHESRALVSCFGELSREGRSHVLRNVRAFRVVEAE